MACSKYCGAAETNLSKSLHSFARGSALTRDCLQYGFVIHPGIPEIQDSQGIAFPNGMKHVQWVVLAVILHVWRQRVLAQEVSRSSTIQ